MATAIQNFKATPILKEEINKYNFVHDDVLSTNDQKANRLSELKRAMTIGNNEKGKSKITFATSDGLKSVETTVWAVDELEVVLKSGVYIPTRAIYDVSII